MKKEEPLIPDTIYQEIVPVVMLYPFAVGIQMLVLCGLLDTSYSLSEFSIMFFGSAFLLLFFPVFIVVRLIINAKRKSLSLRDYLSNENAKCTIIGLTFFLSIQLILFIIPFTKRVVFEVSKLSFFEHTIVLNTPEYEHSLSKENNCVKVKNTKKQTKRKHKKPRLKIGIYNRYLRDTCLRDPYAKHCKEIVDYD